MRTIARLAVPIGVVAGLLAAVGVVGLVTNVVTGGSVQAMLASIAMIGFWAPIAYGVGVELRRHARAWDAEPAGGSDRDRL